MEDALGLQATAADAIQALDALATALSPLRHLDDDPTVQGMLDSLLEQFQEAGEQLHLYREKLQERSRRPPRATTAAAEFVRRDAAPIRAADGSAYTAHVHGQPGADGDWVGWVSSLPASGPGGRRTERETTQPSREALAYWAAGLEPVYFEGAFPRSVTFDE